MLHREKGRIQYFCRPSTGTLLLIIFVGISSLLVLATSRFYFHHRSDIVADSSGPPSKVILAWTTFFNISNSIPSSLDELACSVDNYCRVSKNRSHVHESDAVIFHWSNIDFKDMPPKSSNQKWVLYNYEPPSKMKADWDKLEPIVDQMTWFAMYRSDSDIETPYGGYARMSSGDKSLSDIRLTREEFDKRKPVAWLVSNCNSAGKRQDFVKIIKTHIQVDIFGHCGVPAPCGASDHKNRIVCYRKLAKLYKFYLSFENSVCKDYATEKVFLPLTAGMVPVVFGGANYSRILPPNSFIDALTFQTSKDLADYLLEVGRNFTLYQSYHKWRSAYKIVQYEAPDFHWLCDLCRFLHEEKPRESVVPTQRDLFHEWFYVGGACSAWNNHSANMDRKL